MDIVAIPPAVKSEGDSRSQAENGVSTQLNGELSGGESPVRLGAESSSSRDSDHSSLMSPQSLAFARNYTLFSSKGLNDPDLPTQIAEYNRKHDSLMMLELGSDQVSKLLLN